ncbi:MAG: DUF4157 domain-containing protein [Microcoleus sp. SU_5_3]|nr:DUF4157 domain-containing protein [Microcoleus sp. SU_5_3]
MSSQKQIQKKPITTISGSRSNSFSSPGFAVQSKANNASAPVQQSGDLKTQLSRATRFGHSLSQMATVQSKAASGQSNQTIQRQAVPEEEPEQMKSEQSIQRLGEEEEPEQMKSEQGAIQRQAAPAAPSSSGNSIPGAVRAKMEKSFGTSFGDVNIHTNSAQAKSIGALAYTQGSNVHFAPGRYDPGSASGQSLLGHELTHVVQQRAGRVPKPTQNKALPINADTALEKEADDMGAKAARGELVQMPGASGLSLGGALPMQNSTEPVQCFLPLLMRLMGGPAGIAQGLMGAASGGLGAVMGGGGVKEGLMGAASGGLGSMGGAAGGAAGGIMGAASGGLNAAMNGGGVKEGLMGAASGGLGSMMGGAPAGPVGNAPAAGGKNAKAGNAPAAGGKNAKAGNAPAAAGNKRSGPRKRGRR